MHWGRAVRSETDRRSSTNAARVQNWVELMSLIEQWTERRTGIDIESIMDGDSVPPLAEARLMTDLVSLEGRTIIITGAAPGHRQGDCRLAVGLGGGMVALGGNICRIPGRSGPIYYSSILRPISISALDNILNRSKACAE
jgi:hypothetical protein